MGLTEGSGTTALAVADLTGPAPHSPGGGLFWAQPGPSKYYTLNLFNFHDDFYSPIPQVLSGAAETSGSCRPKGVTAPAWENPSGPM